jgi:2-polyprenyl-3-methyl-5-hydroxy-6-metoxy-1,4-benzoquinol methylase
MNVKTEIKEKYDNFAEKMYREQEKIRSMHKEVSRVLKYFRQRKLDTALKLAGFKPQDKILEVGSNVGQFTTMLARKGLVMTGIDLSDKSVEIAKKNAAMLNLKIDYFTQDAEDLFLLKNETFDGVVSFSTLRYVPNLQGALKAIYRVTKKGGAVVLDFPNRHCPWFSLLKNKFGVEDHIHDHFYTAKELIRLFSETGFSDVEIKKILFTHYTFPDRFLALYKTIDSIAENMPFIKECSAIIFCKGIKT